MITWIWTLAIGVIILLVYLYKKSHKFDDWGIPHPPEIPFFGVVLRNLFRGITSSDAMRELYDLNKNAKYVGIHAFTMPIIVPRDLDLIKTILVKDFDHFTDRIPTVTNNYSVDPLLEKNLSVLKGDNWREVRNLLTPAFTSSKMRAMFKLMSSCAETFVDSFTELYTDKEATNMKDAFSKYTNDVIATCAFGIEVNSLKDPTNEFYVYGTKIVDPPKGIERYRQIVASLLLWKLPRVAKALNLKLMMEEITNFFVNTVETVMKTREEKGITRPDMIQLLMDARGNTSDNLKLNNIDIAAQAMLFFLAGFDVAANNMCIIAHELAVNPDIQKKLRDEINTISKACNGEITYETIANTPYLDGIFLETMRKHPQAPFLVRNCTKAYELPSTLPESKPYLLDVDSLVMIPVTGIHNDPDIYEEPEKFDPERFVGKKTTTADSTLLGFGMGSRMCIGNRFAILETKVLFFYLMKKCSFEICSKTCHPIKYWKQVTAPVPKDGFWLKINKIN